MRHRKRGRDKWMDRHKQRETGRNRDRRRARDTERDQTLLAFGRKLGKEELQKNTSGH